MKFFLLWLVGSTLLGLLLAAVVLLRDAVKIARARIRVAAAKRLPEEHPEPVDGILVSTEGTGTN